MSFASTERPAQLPAYLRDRAKTAWAYAAGRSIAFWEQTLFVLFALSIVLFPFGQALRTALPLLCLPVLVLLYAKDWQNRMLRHLPVWWLLAAFFALIAVEVFASSWFALSWKTVHPNLLRGFLLLFVGLECVRDSRDLRRLILAFALAAVITGLSGVWQFATGEDFISGAVPLTLGGDIPADGFVPGMLASLGEFRLTGPLSTYRVGNYLALIMLPVCGLALLWPGKNPEPRLTLNTAVRAVLTLCVLAPATFVWLGAQSRAGYMAVFGGLYIAWLLFIRPRRLFALLPLVACLLLALFGPERVSLAHALADERASIWQTAWQCFLAHPWFGTGAETYAPACAALGITHLSTGNPVPPHPHSIYAQWLVDGGIAGFVVMAAFAFGLAFWSVRKIRLGLRGPSEFQLFWKLTAFFWAGWCGYLINGLAAHGFYRTWWLATAFSVLGILLGACVRGSMPHGRQTA